MVILWRILFGKLRIGLRDVAFYLTVIILYIKFSASYVKLYKFIYCINRLNSSFLKHCEIKFSLIILNGKNHVLGSSLLSID